MDPESVFVFCYHDDSRVIFTLLGLKISKGILFHQIDDLNELYNSKRIEAQFYNQNCVTIRTSWFEN